MVCVRHAPVYLYNSRPTPVHVHPNTNTGSAIEPLPIYEALRPKYSIVIKEVQPPADMRGLKRGEPSGREKGENHLPEYDQDSG
ncbi:hypothetical protein HOY80DRAFT_902522, partial [Tuber brumale]